MKALKSIAQAFENDSQLSPCLFSCLLVVAGFVTFVVLNW